MREKNRNSIASCLKFPQFTTMNVIDGQAGQVFYASLILYSLTVDNILNIIVLMILSGVVVATLMGENGLITRSGEAKESQRGAAVLDEVKLAINENKMIDEINKTKGVTGGLKTKGELARELWENKGYLTEEEYNKLTGNGETEIDEITIGSVKIDFSKLAIEGAGYGTGGAGGAGGNTENQNLISFSVNAMDGNYERKIWNYSINRGQTWYDWAMLTKDEPIPAWNNPSSLLGISIQQVIIDEKNSNRTIICWGNDSNYSYNLYNYDRWGDYINPDDVIEENGYYYVEEQYDN